MKTYRLTLTTAVELQAFNEEDAQEAVNEVIQGIEAFGGEVKNITVISVEETA